MATHRNSWEVVLTTPRIVNKGEGFPECLWQTILEQTNTKFQDYHWIFTDRSIGVDREHARSAFYD